MRHVAGIDQSLSGLGLVVLDEDGTVVHLAVKTFPATRYRAHVDRLMAVEDYIAEEMRRWNPVCVTREGYSYGSKYARETAGEVGYAVDRGVRKALDPPACYTVVVTPGQLKEYATGNPRASKEQVQKGVVEHWRVHHTNHNLADAHVLARIALAIALRDEKTLADTIYQTHIIDAICNPRKKSGTRTTKHRRKAA